jgi:hypothetical protein
LITDIAYNAVLPSFHWQPILTHSEITDDFSSRADLQSTFSILLEKLPNISLLIVIH